MATTLDDSKIKLYRLLFRGREDVYARYWTNSLTEKSGYKPVFRLNQQSTPLSDEAIKNHLIGKEALGIYPLLSNNTTYLLVVDFDKGTWFNDSVRFTQVAQEHGLPCFIERSKSGNGAHVWFFFETSVSARKARELGKHLLNQAKIKTATSFDRLFPSQDEHSGKGYVNLIALPLQGIHIKQDNTVFINRDGAAYPDQWMKLESVTKISEAVLDGALSGLVGNVSPAMKADKTDTEVGEYRSARTSSGVQAKLILTSQITIPQTDLPDNLHRFLKEKLNFPKPEFYKLERRGYSTWRVPHVIKTLEVTPEAVMTPAGFLSEIDQFAAKHNLVLSVDDQRVIVKPVTFKSTVKLRPEQKKIVRQLLKQDRVILEAKPGFGKTMTALYCMAKIKQPTLIVVHTRSLLLQWKKQIEASFSLDKNDLGIIGENKWQVGNKITIASYQTLARRGVEKDKYLFGFVIIDECHHVPARTFTDVLKNLPAKKVLGLTATAFRRDELDRLMTFYIGPILKSGPGINTSANESKPTQSVPVELMIKQTDFTFAKSNSIEFHELASTLVVTPARNLQITQDVIFALKSGGKCLILTERIDHCDILLDLIRGQVKGIRASIAKGSGTKKDREKLQKRIRQPKFQLLIATGKLVGEGFDWPELTHLFLAFPITWKGKLIQYIGRLERGVELKQATYFYDYVDYQVPMLKLMYFKRLRTYRSLGIVKSLKKQSPKKPVPINQLPLL